MTPLMTHVRVTACRDDAGFCSGRLSMNIRYILLLLRRCLNSAQSDIRVYDPPRFFSETESAVQDSAQEQTKRLADPLVAELLGPGCLSEKIPGGAVPSPAVRYLAHKKFRCKCRVDVGGQKFFLFCVFQELDQRLSMLDNRFFEDFAAPLPVAVDDRDDIGLPDDRR